ncbi:hypothetical protein DFA_01434 [Cavenderia fasciculata]|uniref:Uncharacterized protein n=1 Tax=Cavenderia fasciculata TaxID=261658 RepID=F4PSS0_CACFS|nr:uncharacterized protein DFA_01434 [Cavenderia fasciculata]EGG21548.1 hypothetical protein DFA_01434 [Cavenderia fasciculata]|eukprot:XP_004359398.1 hypothetical protein DFA_01434 [Cavenderia fasciculata]
MALSNSGTIGVVSGVIFGVAALFSIYPPVQDKGLCRILLLTTAICLWSLWIVCFLSQMNPMAIPEPQDLPGTD